MAIGIPPFPENYQKAAYTLNMYGVQPSDLSINNFFELDKVPHLIDALAVHGFQEGATARYYTQDFESVYASDNPKSEIINIVKTALNNPIPWGLRDLELAANLYVYNLKNFTGKYEESDLQELKDATAWLQSKNYDQKNIENIIQSNYAKGLQQSSQGEHTIGDGLLKTIAPALALASIAIPGIGLGIGSFIVESALGQAAAASMSPAILGAIGSGVLTTALTGDVKQGVLSSIGTALGVTAGEAIGDTAKAIFDSPAGQKFATSIGTAMTRAAVLGQDIEKAGLSAATGEAFNLVVGNIPGFSEIEDPKVKQSIINTVTTALNSQGDLSDKISAAALQGTLTYGLSQFEVDGKKFQDLDSKQQALVTTSLNALLKDQPLDKALVQSAIQQTQNEFAKTLKQPTTPEKIAEEPIKSIAELASAGVSDVGTPSFDQRLEESLFAGIPNPTQTELIGFRNLVKKMREEGISDAIISESLRGVRNRPNGLLDFSEVVQAYAPEGMPRSLENRPIEIIEVVGTSDYKPPEREFFAPRSLQELQDYAARQLQPDSVQVWTGGQLQGLNEIVKKLRDANFDDAAIIDFLKSEQNKGIESFGSLLGSHTPTTETGKGTGLTQVTGQGVSEQVSPTQAGIVVGESAAPPDTGVTAVIGTGSGQTGGLPIPSLIAVDAGVKTYDLNNGFTLFAYSDGQQKLMNNESGVIIDLTSDEAQKNIDSLVLADAQASASGNNLPTEVEGKSPPDTITPITLPTDTGPKEPISDITTPTIPSIPSIPSPSIPSPIADPTDFTPDIVTSGTSPKTGTGEATTEGVETGAGVGAGTGTVIGSGTGAGETTTGGAGTGAGAVIQTGTGTETVIGTGAGVGTEAGTGAGTGTGAGAGTGAGTGTQIADLQKEIDELKEQAEKEQKEREEAEKKAQEAAKAKLQYSTNINVLKSLGLGVPGLDVPILPTAVSTTSKTEDLQPFILPKKPSSEFVGPLDEFLKMIETEYENKPPVTPKPTVGAPAVNYYTYGQPSEINELLNLTPEQEEPEKRSGGLVAPLMAEGGAAPGALNIINHSGKARLDFRKGAHVAGPGDGQSDDIPAMLADGEFVFPADVVAALGNGSTKAGSDKLYEMMHSIRARARSAKPKDLPPPALKSPLDYLGRR
jgi:hypothetical protein